MINSTFYFADEQEAAEQANLTFTVCQRITRRPFWFHPVLGWKVLRVSFSQQTTSKGRLVSSESSALERYVSFQHGRHPAALLLSVLRSVLLLLVSSEKRSIVKVLQICDDHQFCLISLVFVLRLATRVTKVLFHDCWHHSSRSFRFENPKNLSSEFGQRQTKGERH